MTTCHVTVIRYGEEEPCGKPAVGYLDPAPWEDEESGPCNPYPACAFHLNASGGRAVTLDRFPLIRDPGRCQPHDQEGTT